RGMEANASPESRRRPRQAPLPAALLRARSSREPHQGMEEPSRCRALSILRCRRDGCAELNNSDRFPHLQTNVVPIHESMGAYNAMQQSDVHSYWEFNYLGTNWIHPLYELPFTGGFPDDFGQAPDTFEDGEIGQLQSIVPGSGPRGVTNQPQDVDTHPTHQRHPH